MSKPRLISSMAIKLHTGFTLRNTNVNSKSTPMFMSEGGYLVANQCVKIDEEEVGDSLKYPVKRLNIFNGLNKNSLCARISR